MSALVSEVNGLRTILLLRAIVCRAAEGDSLHWWDDESLTPYARVILDPLFPRTASVAALRIAFEAARLRYRAVFGADDPRVAHLFSLPDEVEMQLVNAGLDGIAAGDEAVADAEAFRQRLGADWRDYEVAERGAGGMLKIRPRARLGEDPLDIARALASAHSEGQPGSPAFPFVRLG